MYVGTQSGVYPTVYDVGNTTSFSLSNTAAGQAYYVAVAAYAPGPVIGSRSSEVTALTNAAPVLTNPGSQSSTVGSPVSLQLRGVDPAGEPVSYGATQLPAGLSVGASTGFVSGVPTTAGTYQVTAIVTDGVLSDAETFTWTVAGPPVDNVAPQLEITLPTTRTSYQTDVAFITLGGSAHDDSPIVDVTWATDRGNSGQATGRESWIAGIPLQRGPNTITVRARDAAGNVTNKAIIVKSSGKTTK